ncbi:hypothetical protein BCAR13_560053 [Paraburkholderia caribensis]|nr:hypothetical protein BCAR13_560053 [Paraburkholderia caribensis]
MRNAVSAQTSQNVHSKLQIIASLESGGSALPQPSHDGLSSSIPGLHNRRNLAVCSPGGDSQWLKFMKAGLGEHVSAASIAATRDAPGYASTRCDLLMRIYRFAKIGRRLIVERNRSLLRPY